MRSAALALIVAIEARTDGLRAGGRAARPLRAGRCCPASLLAYAVMALVWPWSVADPLNPFRAVEYFSHFFEEPWQELFGGALIPVPDMPRSYVPTLFALKLPEIFLLLGFGGAAGALIAALPARRRRNRRAVLLLVALAALLPLAVTVALRPAMYNGIRHFVFVLPPLAVLGGLAGAWLVDALRTRCASCAGGRRRRPSSPASRLPVVEMARLHPYEYTHFNRLAGGVRRARDRYMLDYWGALVQAGLARRCWPSSPSAARASPPTGAGRSRSAARTARRRSSSVPISRPPGIRRAPTSP